ncbi:hypothetical protein [Streptomyces sp. TRM70350]|uniref:hypothetical protein n=1 Tax=Streptomyces sp. TRM70350 TaxID=2856165 RepID=UPI001C447D72|nr:hypothetical protein [Streptomyces sp. TRM70350]MBV7696578.1 hypothetical protein [Streptomyces sp. TRM70350]
MTGLTGTLAVTGVLGFLPTPAFAEAPQHFRVDVVNSAESNIKVRFFYSGVEKMGGAAMFETSGKEIPTGHETDIAAGSVSRPFKLQTPPDFHDSGYWVEVSRGDDPQDRTVAKFYRHAPKDESKSGKPANPIELTDQKGTSLRISAEASGADQNFPDFNAGRMRIFVTEPAAHVDGATIDGHPGRWDRDFDFGTGNGGWQDRLDNADGSAAITDPTTKRSTLSGLLPNTDYRLVCYDPRYKDVRFNGRKPRPEEVGANPVGFWRTSDDKGQIVALRSNGQGPDQGVCDVGVASPKEEDLVKARQITPRPQSGTSGDTTPIYKLSVQPRTRLYDALDGSTPGVDQAVPDAVRMPPYLVEGHDASGKWTKVGTVLPASAPVIDMEGRKVTYGGATFYFQNKSGQNITHLRVSGGYTGLGWASQVIDLGNVPAPTVTTNDVDDVHVRVTSNPVNGKNGTVSLEANGAVQEQLDITAYAKDNHLIDPSEPKLGEVYDSIYYLDEYDRLITGMYDPHGSWSVTPERGSTMNSGVLMPRNTAQARTADSPMQAYLSTNDRSAGEVEIRPRLGFDVTESSDPDHLTVRPTTKEYAFANTLKAGLKIERSGATFDAADPATHGAGQVAPVYRLKATFTSASDRPFSVALTRYRAITAATELPRNDMQQCAPTAITINVDTDKLVADDDSIKDIGCASKNQQRLSLNVVSRHGAKIEDNILTGF